MEVFKKEVLKRHGKVYDVEFSQILCLNGVMSLIKSMNLFPYSNFEGFVEILNQDIGKKVNEKKEEKVRKLEKEFSNSQIEELEKEVENLVCF
ncbi:hypothetical protein GFV12_06545 [Desulfurobacterium thermolithotrophum]|uniref:hypothetical protein n=1 Tax=Desulfurobacterium thermolithotrophum TaxID=64160 RepID=UPI0013D53EE0|nr:hypothetical protein [Desulfurobacterium thermolithotrophum]